jgi:hypothetical protein
MVGGHQWAEGLAGGAGRFATTHWSVVLAAGGGNTHEAAAALESLCRVDAHVLPALAHRIFADWIAFKRVVGGQLPTRP